MAAYPPYAEYQERTAPADSGLYCRTVIAKGLARSCSVAATT